MGDIDEPPPKVTKFQMDSQFLEGDVTDEGQEEWLSEGILTDDDYNPSQHEAEHGESNSQDESNANEHEDVSQGQMESSAETGAGNIEETLNNFEKSESNAKEEQDISDELETFLIRKSDGKHIGATPVSRDSRKQSEDDGNDTDDLLVDHLITLVEQRPVLWDKTSEEYKNKNIKTTAWTEVCQNLLPCFQELNNQEKTEVGNAVVKKWTGIKDNYAKYVKKLKEINKSGTGAKKLKEYNLYKQLLFLNRNDQNETDSSIMAEETNNQNTQKESPKRKFKSPSRAFPTRKKRNIDTFEEEIMSKLEEPENRHLTFFKAILPSLNKLSDHQTIIFQCRVLQVLTVLHQPSHKYYPQSNYPSSYEGNYETQGPQSSWQSAYQGGYQTTGSSSQSTKEATPPPAATHSRRSEESEND